MATHNPRMIGRVFLLPTAECLVYPATPYRVRVLSAHRDAGYWECVYESGGHPAQHGSIHVHSYRDIVSHQTVEG